MTSPYYIAYSVLLVGAWSVLTYKGFSLDRYEEVKDVPKTVRNNPGAYRPHYYYSPRYTGGK